jgi:hypothetical protein
MAASVLLPSHSSGGNTSAIPSYLRFFLCASRRHVMAVVGQFQIDSLPDGDAERFCSCRLYRIHHSVRGGINYR